MQDTPLQGIKVLDLTQIYQGPYASFLMTMSGADVVKVLPAAGGGPSYFKDIKGPLPQVELMPTGGVDINTTPEFIKNGACAVGAGSAMVDKQAVAD